MSVLMFNTITHFDHGVRRELPAVLKSVGMARPLFVTDDGVIQAGVFKMATEALPAIDPGHIFHRVPPNPTDVAVEEAQAVYRAKRCDGIVAIGGGAALDLAKGVALIAEQDELPIEAFSNAPVVGAAKTKTPPLVLIPTTSGTGSEVSIGAMLVFRNGTKAPIRCAGIISAAVCDPELTLKLPARITAATGMDALAHCIETYCSPLVNPPADAIALDGMQRIFASIVRAVSDGSDAQARWDMMMGSLEGAICFQKRLGAVHALSHPIGARGPHHGTLNAILLPHVLRHNAEFIGPKLEMMRRQAGWPADANVPDMIASLIERIGLPLRLRDIGVAEGDLQAVSEEALHDTSHPYNPRPMTQPDYLAVLQAAY